MRAAPPSSPHPKGGCCDDQRLGHSWLAPCLPSLSQPVLTFGYDHCFNDHIQPLCRDTATAHNFPFFNVDLKPPLICSFQFFHCNKNTTSSPSTHVFQSVLICLRLQPSQRFTVSTFPRHGLSRRILHLSHRPGQTLHHSRSSSAYKM